MLAEGRSFLLVAPHVALFPGFAVFTTVLGINFVGDGLRDWLSAERRVTAFNSGIGGSRSSSAHPAAGA